MHKSQVQKNFNKQQNFTSFYWKIEMMIKHGNNDKIQASQRTK